MRTRHNRPPSLSKPHPYMLDAIAAARGDEVAGLYYVGDMPDDMLAASRARAGFAGIGCLASARDKDDLSARLIDAGAAHLIEDLSELKSIIAKCG